MTDQGDAGFWEATARRREDENELLRGALGVVIDEIEGGDLKYAIAVARKALERESLHRPLDNA